MSRKPAAAPASGNPPRKIDQLRALMAGGHWAQAMSLASRWPDLGEHRDAIKTAASAKLSPRLYEGMGKDPEALFRAGIQALKERYGVPAERCPECDDELQEGVCSACYEAFGMGGGSHE